MWDAKILPLMFHKIRICASQRVFPGAERGLLPADLMTAARCSASPRFIPVSGDYLRSQQRGIIRGQQAPRFSLR
jgi:hypothetical protein